MSAAQIEAADVAFETPPSGLWHDAWFRLRRNPAAIAGFVFLSVFVLVAIFASLLAPYGPLDQNLKLIEKGCCPGPSAHHWFGVDRLGRDEFTRILYDGLWCFGAVQIVGADYERVVTGGGKASTKLPQFKAVNTYLGNLKRSLSGTYHAFDFAKYAHRYLAEAQYRFNRRFDLRSIFARLLRGSVLAQRENDFVLAARSVGVRRRSILVSHILPNAISPVIVQGTLALATAIIDVAGLSFLGLGDQDPARPEWGAMLTDANEYLQVAPFLAIVPGLAIVVSALGFNLIGDGLREALDPKLRGR